MEIGYIDPRGYTMNITTASKKFLEGLLKVFESWDLSCKVWQNRASNTNIYRVRISGKEQITKLSNIIYKFAKDENFHIYKRVYLT